MATSSLKNNKAINVASLLKDILAQKTPPKKLLIISPDNIRRERITNSLLKKFCSNFKENTAKPENLNKLNAENLNLSNINNLFDEINSLSLFSSQKFILINNCQNLSTSLNKKILDLLESLNENTCLIFSAAKMAANNQIYNYFKKNKFLLELNELKGIELTRWITKEFKNLGIIYFDELLTEAIIQSTNSDPDKIFELINRLSLYIDGDKATIEDLGELSKFLPQASEFALIDNLPNKNNLWKSEMLLNQIFNSDKNSFALLGLIARNYSNYTNINYLRNKALNLQEIRQKLNISPWIFNKQSDASRKYNIQELYMALKAILIADTKLKNKNLGDVSVFSELISKL